MPKEQGPLSGFRDMLAEQMIPRRQMIDTIEGIYKLYGFVPLDTPAIERYETLTGKYGSEGEKLMYKFNDHGGRPVALRYDLTVPLARVVAQHRSEITLPYKRYQIGNVWRGESPQAGRYREFMQFDADTVGTASVIADAEIIQMMADTMKALGVDAIVRVNNRRILDALVEKTGLANEKDVRALIGIIDKTEKVGREQVIIEIKEKHGNSVGQLVDSYLNLNGNDDEKFKQIEDLLGNSQAAELGIENLRQVFSILRNSNYDSDKIIFDQTIARGLDYYTGIIYETTLKQLPNIGSVCSGGRYDKLVAALSSGEIDLPAVGTSVGVDRLFAALQELGKLETKKTVVDVLIANFNINSVVYYTKVATMLRKNGISTEIHYEPTKINKQVKFADKLGIPYVVFLGSEEQEKGVVSVKNLSTGEQFQVPLGKLIEIVAHQK